MPSAPVPSLRTLHEHSCFLYHAVLVFVSLKSVFGALGLHASVSLGGPEEAGLANITATMMNLMGFEAPADYEPSLIKVA